MAPTVMQSWRRAAACIAHGGEWAGLSGSIDAVATLLIVGARKSELDWVIVRPVILTNGPKTNTYRAVVDPRGWTGFISRADVADFLIKQIDDDAFFGKTPVLTS
jgi:hypothetical protein